MERGQLALLLALDERGHQRVLVREILIETANADASPFSNSVGIEAGESLAANNVSSRLQDCFTGCSRALLSRQFSWSE
jgi:hypothetical protein